MTPLGRPGDKRGWVWRPAKPFSGSLRDYYNKKGRWLRKGFSVDSWLHCNILQKRKKYWKNVCFLSCLTTTKMEYWTFVRHKSFSDVLVSRYSLQYIWHLMIEQKYMQIKGTKLTGNIFWAPNFKTRFVNYASLRQMKNKRGQWLGKSQ